MPLLFGRRMTAPPALMPAPKMPTNQMDPLGQGLGRRRSLFGNAFRRLTSADGLQTFGAMLQQMDGGSELTDYIAARDDQQMRRDIFGQQVRGQKMEEAQAEQARAAREAAIAALPEDQRLFARVAPDDFFAAQAPLGRRAEAELEISRANAERMQSQFEETMRHNRATEGIDYMRAARENQRGMPTLAEARQWTNSYNDDVRQTLGDLGNMRAAIPYASQVVEGRGRAPGNFRMNDVALLRAAARAQTGPGVLTESEVFGTLSPSLQQDLMRGRAYADIGQSGIRPEDRLALAEYVTRSARNASSDLWRRYNDAEGILTERGIRPDQVGISAPEFLHPDDMESFNSVPSSSYRQGRNYIAPSGRQYQYLGDGRWRYSGRAEYDRSRSVRNQGTGAGGAPPRRPSGVPPTARWDESRQRWVE